MADEMKHAWSEVGGRFSALGDAVKQRAKAKGTADAGDDCGHTIQAAEGCQQ